MNLVSTAELVGYAAGMIVAISLAPQVIKSWKTKSTQDISLGWTLIYASGLLLWIAYGFLIGSWPLMLTVTVEFLMAESLMILKIKHG